MVSWKRCLGIFCVVSAVFVVNSSWILLPRFAGQKMPDSYAGGEYLGNVGVVMQTSYNDCAPASLQMVLDRYEIPSTVGELTRRLKPGVNGSTMLALRDLAEAKGLHAEGWRLRLQDFLTAQFPAILFIPKNHFVVADSIGSGNVFLRDPAVGRIKLPVSELPGVWNGEALVFRKE